MNSKIGVFYAQIDQMLKFVVVLNSSSPNVCSLHVCILCSSPNVCSLHVCILCLHIILHLYILLHVHTNCLIKCHNV